jgi:hypothetical protein
VSSKNPFTAKVERRKDNPFSARASKLRAARLAEDATRLAELDAAIEEAEDKYVGSLNNALRKGITRDQIVKLWNICDRDMHALMSLSKQRARLNGQPDRRQ